MKIIASMLGNKFMVEVDGRELRELNSDIKPEVGAEYEITKAAETLESLRGLQRRRLNTLKNQIAEIQKIYDGIEENCNALMLMDSLKTEYDQ